MKYLILLLFLVSCGKSSDDGAGYAGCSLDVTQVKKTWKSEVTGDTYNLTSCGVNTVCRICFSNLCNTFNDLELIYYENGTVFIDYFMIPKVIKGSWQVCDERLELYGLSNNTPNETFVEE